MINIAEILKDCPKGTKLYSPLCGECQLYSVENNIINVMAMSQKRYPNFNKFGQYYTDIPDSECLLFPSKENRDWDTFQKPFKDGDIVFYNNTIAIFKEWGDKTLFRTYFAFYPNVKVIEFSFEIDRPLFGKGVRKEIRLATEDEKKMLFDAIKANGYKWNPETKTLEKLIEPKFKVGDKVRHKNNHNVVFTINDIEEDFYTCVAKMAFAFNEQDNYELVPNKFDITTLKPFDSRVLVRDSINSIHEYDEEYTDVWRPAIWGVYVKDNLYPFGIRDGCYFQYCIPYEGNEHLLGTTNDCDEFYKTWE